MYSECVKMQKLLFTTSIFCSMLFWRGNCEIRIDCHPEPNATESVCWKRNCLWIPSSITGAPWCFFDSNDVQNFAGYEASENPPIILTRRPTPSMFGNDYVQLKFSTKFLTKDILRVKIGTSGLRSFSFHPEIPNLQNSHKISNMIHAQNADYRILHEKSPFGFKIADKSDPTDYIFDSTLLPGLTFATQFLMITTRVPTRNVYGFGEQYHPELRRNFNFTRLSLFTHDYGPFTPGMNIYGFHPFYMGLTKAHKVYGVFLHNTHGMDVALQPDPNTVTFRVIGGELDFYFLLGPTGDNVVQQYTSLVGRPMLPPYWSLGFQLSRYGYRNLTYLKQVWDRNRRAGIPQDVQIIDIDYMDDFKDFTYDSKNRFKGLKEFLENEVHGSGRKFVPIIDPAIAARTLTPYAPLTTGLARHVFIMDKRTGKPFLGQVWPGLTYFPDFTNPAATTYWRDMLLQFHKVLPFDGIWLDMNDPSNFFDGAIHPKGCTNNSLNYPPYIPTPYMPLFARTLCMDAVQHAGSHYQWHNYYGFYETVATDYGLRAVFPGKRPFILSRSTSPGSGAYTAHWSGDNSAQWSQLSHSLISMIEFNMFGVPFVGADICGFGGEATEEMCLRWSQVGAFYPYCRNHNNIDNKVDQDPGAWPPTTAQAIRYILLQRYTLLPYLYTLFYHAHSAGNPVVRPLFFEHPGDSNTWNMHDQFLWGSGLMVTPILAPNTTRRWVYFPRSLWYNAYDNLAPVGRTGFFVASIPKNSIGLFIRGGSIIPYHYAGEATTTTELRKRPFGIVVATDETGSASDDLFWDDGESADSIRNEKFCLINFRLVSTESAGNLTFEAVKSGCPEIPPLSSVRLAGIATEPSDFLLGGRPLPKGSAAFYNATSRSAVISNLNLTLKNVQESLTWTGRR